MQSQEHIKHWCCKHEDIQPASQNACCNLFHSFAIFSITSSENATFYGRARIQNIISRVTSRSCLCR
ncbi:MAG: hypothetical protein HQL08_01675 [Nitrospirae bacterium]|nr:hypothetical protein [Nitrospirota bacterium]